MRIVSLLPSATEIACALGLEAQLVGRSHECDYPSAVESLPACTAPKYASDGTSYEIDQRVKAIVQEGLSVYRVDAELLNTLKPDVILTQDHCEVCAASYADVKRAVQQQTHSDVEIVSVSPTDLDGIFLSIEKISRTLKVEEKGVRLIQQITNDLNILQSETSRLPSPAVGCIEWIEPLMTAGNWMPELIEIAGGKAVLAEAGTHSSGIEWSSIQQADPDLLLIAPCGYDIDQTLKETEVLKAKPGWEQLEAVQNDRVYVMDGNRYFNRPGPRIVDSARILAEIFYPHHFEANYHPDGWIKLSQI